MRDVARLAGVSESTVSRALAGGTLVRDETQARIVRLAALLNYSIDIRAKNLRRQTSRTIAVVIPRDPRRHQRISDPFFVSMVGSLADALALRGYDMLLARVDAARLDLVADLEASGRAEGIILIGQWRHHDQLNALAARQVALVVWGACLAHQAYITVGSDNISGGLLATDHLIDTGRRRIAFLGDSTLPEVAQRLEGYRRALCARGIGVDSRLVIPAAFTDDGARKAVDAMMGEGTEFDGLVASSDLMAMRAIGALRDHGVSVPGHVGVVVYDDVDLSRHFHPSITTIGQPIVNGGQVLVDTLLALKSKAQPVSTVFPAFLVVRESSAPHFPCTATRR